MEHAEQQQQHPIGTYLWVWGLLFVLSVLSYMVDYSGLEGFIKWFFIVLFMWLKAGLIVAFFMHMAWERLAIISAVLVPPAVLAVLVGLMAVEANHTLLTRLTFFIE
ncbi:cytochrome C oxidase subunit IV family protein [Ectothiorhodospiraceae bacterium WFHF3C12]|nr:cytochrome C oxidase subunit IV family protein [Ectothiorhodospiraceae bacterium WFHF3C12]